MKIDIIHFVSVNNLKNTHHFFETIISYRYQNKRNNDLYVFLYSKSIRPETILLLTSIPL